jgi:hypothetical protein
MLVTTLAVILIGGIYMVLAKPYERGNAPAGDAHRLQARTGPGVVAPIDA